MSDISSNALTLLDTQDRIDNWRNLMEDIFPQAPQGPPRSIFVPLQDLTAVVEGFSSLPQQQYTVTGARIYLVCPPGVNNQVAAILVPVGYANDDPSMFIGDIIIDVKSGSADPGTFGPDTLISAYDFTQPCPPMCEGQATIITDRKISVTTDSKV